MPAAWLTVPTLRDRRRRLEQELAEVDAELHGIERRSELEDVDSPLLPARLDGQCTDLCRCRQGIDMAAELAALFPECYGILSTLPPTSASEPERAISPGGGTYPTNSSCAGVAGMHPAAPVAGDTPAGVAA